MEGSGKSARGWTHRCRLWNPGKAVLSETDRQGKGQTESETAKGGKWEQSSINPTSPCFFDNESENECRLPCKPTFHYH